jgi:ABC-type glycerol-3-phosphate transport system permease component
MLDENSLRAKVQDDVANKSGGLFFAHLCAVAFVVCLPVLAAGWMARDKLVRGLSLGAVK